MATRRRFVSTSAGVMIIGGLAAELLLPACGPGVGDDDDAGSPTPTPIPTPTPDINGGIMTLILSNYPALQNVDGFATFTVPGAGAIIVVHTDVSTFVCLSRTCTHMGCSVAYSGGTLDCPCHFSSFATNGSVLLGPAVTPLHSYDTTTDGTNVVVDLNS